MALAGKHEVRDLRPTLALLLLAPLLVPPAAAQPLNAGPEQVHVTLGAEPGTLVVHWAVLLQPYTALDTPTVTWQNGNKAAQLVGTIKPTGPGGRTSGPYETYVYAATIGPFAPDTEITYRVGSAQRGTSSPRTIHLPPESDQPLRLVAYGDIGIDATAPDGSRMPTRSAHPAHDIRDLTLAQKPDLLLIAGDLAYSNGRDGWDTFMRFSDPLQSTVPTMPVLGNHEWVSEDGLGYAQFLNEYVLPGDERSFTFRAGPVTFIAVNTDSICNKSSRGGTGTPPRPCDTSAGESVNTGLVEWVAKALQDATDDDTPWTIVYHHHPPYSWGDHGSDWAVQTQLAPLYAQHRVDFVITAHDHMYSRTHPVIDGVAKASGAEYPQGLAPVYVVAGGGGRSLYELKSGPTPTWLAHAEKTHHLTRIDVTTQRLDFVALRADGSQMDQFSIVAGPAPDSTDAARPTPGAGAPALLLLVLVWVGRKSRTL